MGSVDSFVRGPANDAGGPPIAAMSLAERKVLLVDDHEVLRLGIRSLHTEVAGVMIDWVEAASL